MFQVLISDNNSDENDDIRIDETDYSVGAYNVRINVTTDGNYSIVVPFPSNNGSFASDVLNNLSITNGTCQFHIVEMEKGLDRFGLQILFQSDLELMWTANSSIFYYLSMENRTDRNESEWYHNSPEWLSLLNTTDNSSVDLFLRYELDQWSSMRGYIIKGTVITGWNYLNGQYVGRQD